MITPPKIKVNLSDYDYRKDIENRLLMAQFTVFDVAALEEILSGSLSISIEKLLQHLDTQLDKLIPSLAKLSKTGLFTYTDTTLIVDKERRKYFESQISKFDNNFKPGMDFLQSLLRKVSIHHLPVWFSLSKTTSNIFESLVEKYLCSPKIYQRHLQELQFDNPILKNITNDVFDAPDFQVSASFLRKKYSLSPEQFEEHLLSLEFHFVCCLGYKRSGEGWEEIVTPFYEWREFLRFKRDTSPRSIENEEEIQLTCDSSKAGSSFDLSELASDKNFRLIENSLERIASLGWVYLDDFIQGMLSPIGKAQPISLVQQGRQWRYALPSYSPEELSFIKHIILERLPEAGLVLTGTHNERICFKLSPLGFKVLSSC